MYQRHRVSIIAALGMIALAWALTGAGPAVGGSTGAGNGFLAAWAQEATAGSPHAPSFIQARTPPVEELPTIEAIYADETVPLGTTVNFRARVQATAHEPVEYHWDVGTGQVLEGKMIAYRFRQTGRHVVTVKTRNAFGVDSASIAVRVIQAPGDDAAESSARGAGDEDALSADPSVAAVPAQGHAQGAYAPSALRSSQGIARGTGYTWIVATHLSRFPAELEMHRYRRAGYRTDVVDDTRGRGSVAFRVAIGQFETVRQALVARRSLPARRQTAEWLLPLSDIHRREDR